MKDQGKKYLKPEDIKRLANFRFAAHMMIEGWMSGRHRAKGRGASTDFLEYREYSQGDDLRLIDWRVFARTDRHSLRTFENETRLECHIFVDSSASMGFRDEAALSKLEYSSFFAACVAWLVVKYNDRVSLQLFDDKIRQFIPPGSTHRHLNHILDALEHNRPGGQTSISAALERSYPLLKQRGTLIVVSDFLDSPVQLFKALSPYLHRKFKIVLVQVLDPAEVSLKNYGLSRYEDSETGERITINPARIQDAYKERFQQHNKQLRELSLSRGVKFLSAQTTELYYRLFDELALQI